MIQPAGLEVRIAVEVRAIAGARRLEGYAAVFNSQTRIGGPAGFLETVMPGCFRRSLESNPDILACMDHDPTRLLGRTKSGTLRLSEDTRGLAFSVDLPGTQLGADVLALAERGDLGGASFSFRVPKGGDAWPARDQRQLISVDLYEVSCVAAWPAYSQTSVNARSAGRLTHGARLRLLAVL